MNPREYAELICRSNYSFLRGASHPHELVERASELGLTALAITDRNGVYGVPKAYRSWKNLAEERRQNFRLIIGTELTLKPSQNIQDSELGTDSILLLSRTRRAYGILCRLITQAHQDKPKGAAHLSWLELNEFLKNSEHHSAINDLVWLAPPPKQTLSHKKSSEWLLQVESLAQTLESLNPQAKNSIFFPIFQFLDSRDSQRLKIGEELAKHFGEDQLIASNEVHYHIQDRRALQDVLTAIRNTTTLKEAGYQLFSNGERYLKSADQMSLLFKEWPQLLVRTNSLAQKFTFDLSELRYRYPSEWIPHGKTAQSYLEELTWIGAAQRYGSLEKISSSTRSQLEHELKLISQLNFADYFLTLWEIVDFAKSKDILCQGRGSAANSAVCYCLGITAIDPVRMNLLFERFISVERGEPPDIDVDFEHERREEVIQHVYDKYGRHRAGMVAALITYRSRSALKEVSKAIGKTSALVNDFSEEIYGFPRHLSIHSGGFTLSADPLIETVPIEPARMPGRTIVQWDKDDLDSMGLLKVDLLSLGMLSALQKTLKLTHNKLYELPAEDPETFRMIQRADTVGVFQIESRAQMSMLPRLLPKSFYDLVVEIAIVRPGPIVGNMVHPYLRRKQKKEKIFFPDPRLEPILSRTLGVPLFQEQIMKIAIQLAGFSPGEADQLRRAIGAWRSSGSIAKMGERLMQGLLENGIPKSFADQIFEQIQGFAEYGFPESHAASFALLAYASAYLKCHHPAEFTCSIINSQPMGFYSNHTLIDDAKRHGVGILPLNLEHSQWDCTIESRSIRLGFRLIRGMSFEEYQTLERARRDRAFSNLDDFLARTKIRRNVLNRLALGDVFSSFGKDQRNTLWHILAASLHTDPFFSKKGDQLELFQAPDRKTHVSFKTMSRLDIIYSDYQVSGVSVLGHPMQEIRKIHSKIPQITTSDAKKLGPYRKIKIAGMIIVMQRPPTAKGTCFATLEDESGFLDLILKKDTFEKYQETIEDSSVCVVSGNLQRNGNSDSHSATILVEKIERFS